MQFADSFTSASQPTIEGGSQEDYLILNNQSSGQTIFTVDGSVYKSVFANYELSRTDSLNEFRQAGSFIMSFDGTLWTLNLGSYQGSDLISDTLTSSQNITLTPSTSLGVGSLQYTSGNMGAGYVGTLKIIITRVVA